MGYGLFMAEYAADTVKEVATLQEMVVQCEAEIARQSAELLARDLLIEQLKLQLTNLRRQRFGTKSEALDAAIGQLELTLEDIQRVAAGSKHIAPASEDRSTSANPSVPLCRIIFLGKRLSSAPVRVVSSAAVGCATSGMISQKFWNSCPDVSR